jgi:hypothetical protein
MDKYILTVFENGYERMLCIGTSLEGMRKTAENSNFSDYAIYETKLIDFESKNNIVLKRDL